MMILILITLIYLYKHNSDCVISVVFSSLSLSQVLAGEEADITSSMLNTDDDDSPAEELVYHVEAPTGGAVALKEAPEDAILNFTQAHINNGEVIFIHEGEEDNDVISAYKRCHIIKESRMSIIVRGMTGTTRICRRGVRRLQLHGDGRRAHVASLPVRRHGQASHHHHGNAGGAHGVSR